MELGWRLELAQPKFKRDLGMDWVCAEAANHNIGGCREVPDMSPEITLLVLCLHGGKHAWSRLIWICDVAAATGFVDRPRLERGHAAEAKKSGLCRTLALGVLLAHRVAGATVPPVILRRL